MEDSIDNLPNDTCYTMEEVSEKLQNIRSDLKRTISLLGNNSYCSSDLFSIIELMDNFIIKHCNHTFVYDSIDISPEHSRTIRYCSKCLT